MTAINRRGFLGGLVALMAAMPGHMLRLQGIARASGQPDVLQDLKAALDAQDIATMRELVANDFVYASEGSADFDRAHFLTALEPLCDPTRVLSLRTVFQGGVPEEGPPGYWQMRNIGCLLVVRGYREVGTSGRRVLCERATSRTASLALRERVGPGAPYELLRWEEVPA
jgi:hypothetical protein